MVPYLEYKFFGGIAFLLSLIAREPKHQNKLRTTSINNVSSTFCFVLKFCFLGFVCCVQVFCLLASIYDTFVPGTLRCRKRGVRSSRTGIMDGCELSCGCSEPAQVLCESNRCS